MRAPARAATRLIPAHAGKTAGGRSRGGCSRAHPRSRGENFQAELEMIQERGSSPLTRGKRTRRRADRIGPGLIPAHAGKTLHGHHGNPARRAHPRSRGENGYSGEGSENFSGSSPLTRGKRTRSRTACRPPGLIPAHAGKTRRRRRARRGRRAHPRSRGENMKKADAEALKQGSSPLTRGKLSRPRWR